MASSAAKTEHFVLEPNGWVPNNARLPVLVYRGVSADSAKAFEKLFEANDWPPQWRGGVYDYHHYHSTTHEVLGVYAGHAQLMLGGERGRVIRVERGDVLVLPVGTGHCRVEVSDDFAVVGAYPPKKTFDICREAPDEAARARMAAVPVPTMDPVMGGAGPLVVLWRP